MQKDLKLQQEQISDSQASVGNRRFQICCVFVEYGLFKHQIDVLYVSFKNWDSQVSAYTPFHFSFTVPLSASKKYASHSRREPANENMQGYKRRRFIPSVSCYLLTSATVNLFICWIRNLTILFKVEDLI